MSRTYNAQHLKLMTLFESMTRTRVKDCFTDNNDMLTFVVPSDMLGKAIGKRAANVKRLEQKLKKKIRIVGFDDDPAKMLEHLLSRYKVSVELNGDTLEVNGAQDSRTKGLIIGRNQSNLKNNLEIIQKYFKNIKNIKVN